MPFSDTRRWFSPFASAILFSLNRPFELTESFRTWLPTGFFVGYLDSVRTADCSALQRLYIFTFNALKQQNAIKHFLISVSPLTAYSQICSGLGLFIPPGVFSNAWLYIPFFPLCLALSAVFAASAQPRMQLFSALCRANNRHSLLSLENSHFLMWSHLKHYPFLWLSTPEHFTGPPRVCLRFSRMVFSFATLICQGISQHALWLFSMLSFLSLNALG